jgi:hypothetical protein
MMGDFFGTVTQFSLAMAAVTSVCVSGAAQRVHECEGSRGQKCSLFLRYQCASAPPRSKMLLVSALSVC